jgi:hypothetical protein
MICSSVNRFPFIELSFPKSMENSKPRSASFRGQGQQAERDPGLGFPWSCGVSEMDGWGDTPDFFATSDDPEEWE